METWKKVAIGAAAVVVVAAETRDAVLRGGSANGGKNM